MQVTEKSAEGLKRAYAVVLPAATLAERRDARLAEIGRDLRLPGFRPGKVPAAIVKQRFGGSIMGEVLEKSLDEAARTLVTERGLKPALQPKVEIVNWSDGADLEFNLDIEVLPEIALPDLKAIAVEKLVATPEESEVEARLAERSAARASCRASPRGSSASPSARRRTWTCPSPPTTSQQTSPARRRPSR
jgi:trigger factor